MSVNCQSLKFDNLQTIIFIETLFYKIKVETDKDVDELRNYLNIY